MKKFVALTILILCLRGCSAQVPDVTENHSNNEPANIHLPSETPAEESTPAEETAPAEESTPAEETTPIYDVMPPDFTFKAQITDGLPDFTFEFFKEDLDSDDTLSYRYTVRVSNDELPDHEPQIIEIESSRNWNAVDMKNYIDLIDIDFDGFCDIQAFISSGTVNVYYAYYRFNVFAGQEYGEFDETPFFEMSTIGYDLYPDTKQIISSSRDIAVSNPRTMYQLSDTQNGGWLGKYHALRRERWEITSDGDIMVDILFGVEKIYSVSVAVNDGEYTLPSELVDYLRFGAVNPIDKKAAAQLLYSQYGQTDSVTDSSLSVTFEEMVVHEKLSCYKFRIQRLVDNSHWSTVGFAAVTPDGRIIELSD